MKWKRYQLYVNPRTFQRSIHHLDKRVDNTWRISLLQVLLAISTTQVQLAHAITAPILLVVSTTRQCFNGMLLTSGVTWVSLFATLLSMSFFSNFLFTLRARHNDKLFIVLYISLPCHQSCQKKDF